MFCSKCGHRISPTEKFCGNCGAIAETKKENEQVKDNKPKYQVIDPKKPTFDNKVEKKVETKIDNKPVDKKMTFHAGASGQAGSVSYMDKYERPKIQTMETRAMNQVQQLDTQQKSLAIALQDAVNHKDLNAFIQAYQQMYGITLSKRDAEVAMTQMARTAETQQILAQGMDYFKRAFGTETGTDLYYMAQNGNGQLASAISAIITNGMVPPQQAEIFAQEYMNQKMSEYKQQNPNATMQDAFNYGLGAYNRNIAQFSNYQAANLSHDTGWLARTKAWWSTL